MSKKPSERGCVTLVGAGPGDPDLLTLKALKAMQKADVILFDSLVTDEILSLARRGATRINVGKRAGGRSCRQEDINTMMVHLAQKGRNIVRLKSGDPSIFGRSGEEIATLTTHGIKVSIVPGITTASALAADVRTSLTHRACAQSLRFVTAHGAKGGLPPDMDWQGMADPTTTLIVYMGARTSGEFARHLLDHGRAGATPVIVSRNVSRADARHLQCTLAGLAQSGVDIDHTDPVVISIGDVFADAHCLGDTTPGDAADQSGEAAVARC